MRRTMAICLMLSLLYNIGSALGNQRTDVHQQNESCEHEDHRHEVAAPELIEANRLYDAAWAQWQQQFFGVTIDPGMVVADIGAGDGDLSVLIAQRVGAKGLVYATEIDAKKLKIIDKKAADSGLNNVVPMLSREDDPLLPPGQSDVAILVEVYHHISNKKVFLERLRSRLNTGARLVIVEADINQRGGDSDGCYSDPDLTRRQAEGAGFHFENMRFEAVRDCDFFVLTATAP